MLPDRGTWRLTRVFAEQHFAVGGHRGLAARGVVGQDRHHIAADGTELVIVINPAGAVELA